jgi:branched-chain amino acid transport system permease protein
LDQQLSLVLQFIFSGLINGSIYAIVALGFTIIYNATGIINFAQGEFLMLGALLMATLSAIPHVPFAGAFAGAVAATIMIGMLLERLAIRPLRNGSIISLVTITVGASIVLRGAAMLVWGTDPRPLATFSDPARLPIIVKGAVLQLQGVWIFAITMILVVLLHLFYHRTLIGKAMRATAVNRRAAQLVGVRVDRMVLGSFGLSAALGAIAGIIIAPISGASFDMGMMLGLKGFAAAILGGLGSSAGAIVGGLCLGLLESVGAGYISSAYKDAIAFLLLLIILFVKPSGLLKRIQTGGL